MTVLSLRAPLCVLAAASLTAPFATAQTPTLPETRITATRFAEPQASLPLGVSVITADEIRASGAGNVTEAVMRVLGIPGRQDFFGGGEYSLDLRGFGITADNNQVVILDGVRLSESDLSAPRLASIPIDTIEQIEVLRGSAAVLYGEGATGGVIVITTKGGSGRQQASGGSVHAAAGTHALRDLRASGTFNAGPGLVLDAHAQERETKGYRANSASSSEAASVGAQWSNDWLRLGARVARDDLDARLPGGLSAAQYAADPRQSSSPDDRASIGNERVNAFAQAELGAWQLGLDLGRREKQLRSLSSGFSFDYDVDATTYAVRGRHQAVVGTIRNSLVLGLDTGNWRRAVLGAFGSLAQHRSRAVYAKDDVLLPGGTRVSVGARTERVEKDNSASGTGFDDRQNAWELGVSHPFGGQWTGYARLARSFRLANVDEFNFTSPGVTLRPQVSRDAEVGARWSYARGKFEARVYRSALTDEIGFDPNAAGPFGPGANINFDPTRREGLELDWAHTVKPGLGVRVNAITRKATFRAGSYAGNDVPLVPRRVLAVRADWTPVAGHRLNAGVNWVSSQHPDFNNACRMPAYTTADVRYAWTLRPNAEVALGVTNLFDRKYFSQAFGCAGGTTGSIYPEPGRQVTGSLRVQF